MRLSRRGAVLPIVLLCAVLLAGMVVAFQFVSGSDYKLTARLIQESQARALADLAFDEIWFSVFEISTLPGSPKPPWLADLIDKLDDQRKRAGTGDLVDTRIAKSFDVASELPVTAAASKEATEIADLKSVVAKIGPFQVDGGPFGGQPRMIYQEEIFADANKDLRPWDLRGPLSLEVKVSGSRSPIQFGQTYQRGQTLMFTDTTPVGREFCVFTYGPPPSADYALNDLNSPSGMLTLHPQHDKGRVMVRGPLLLAPEEAPPGPPPRDKLYLGNEAPLPNGTTPPPNYPDLKYAPELAMVPGPRELQHPDATGGTITGVVSSIIPNVLDGVLAGVEARRPGRDESYSEFKTKLYKFSVNVEVCPGNPFNIRTRVPQLDIKLARLSLVLARGAGTGEAAVYQSLDYDRASYYPPMAYQFCLRSPGQQKFMIDSAPSINNFAQSFQGIHIPFGAGAPQKFTPSLGRQSGSDANARLEGDVVVTEPVLRADGKNQNVGLMGLYGVAQFEAKTYLSIDILRLSYWLLDKAIEKLGNSSGNVGEFIQDNGIGKALAIALACGLPPPKPADIIRRNKDTLAQQALTNLQIDPSTKFLIRRYRVEPPPPVSFPTDEGTLGNLVGNRRALVVPYGAYTHEVNFWQSTQMQASRQAVIDTLKTKDPLITMDDTEILNRLLKDPSKGLPEISAVDPNWPDADVPPNRPSEGLEAALKNLCETYAGKLNRFNDAADKLPAAVVPELFGKQRTTAWALPLNPAEKLRPRGVFLPVAAAPPANQDLQQLSEQFPRGFFPPKYRDFLRIATRQYETLEEYAQAEGVAGAGGVVLPLKGAVFIRKLKFTGGLTYRGRGLILTYTAKDQEAPILSGRVRPETAGAGSHLTLVHRVAPEVVKAADMPLLELGPEFEGTVVSDTGVKPSAGNNLVIKGNLVAGLLNKAKQGGATVDVFFDAELSRPLATEGMKPLWTPEMTGPVTSADPGS